MDWHFTKNDGGNKNEKRIFDLDGPFNRIGTFVFDMVFLNLLWFLFSIPLVTFGASTTALFYVVGKKVRKEDGYIFKDFWKSFKMNFKQATAIWLILILLISVLVFNMSNVALYGELGRYIFIVQAAVLLQLLIISLYIFLLLSRLYLTLSSAFKLDFVIGNKHFFTTILCIILFEILIIAIYIYPPVILFGVVIYAYFSYYLIGKILKRYLPKAEDGGQENEKQEQEMEE